MPFYDLRCTACNHEFNIQASWVDKEAASIPCPVCGDFKLNTVFKSAPNYLKTQEEESSCPHSHVCGSGCCHYPH